MAKGDVKINLKPLRKFRRIVRAGLAGTSGPFHDMFQQWGVRYFAFLRTRFRKFSRGGGDWAPLAASTLRRRRGGKKQSILWDTGTMFRALQPGSPGNLFVRIRDGVRCGFGGGGKHVGGGTIADIARRHNAGDKHLPQRKIIVPPDRPTITGMVSDMRRAVQRSGRQAERAK